MESKLTELEYRIREIEKQCTKTEIRISELAFAHSANSKMMLELLPKVQNLIDDDRLAKRVEKQLKNSESAGWTKRERYMGLFIGIATIGNIGLNTLFLFHK